MKGKEVLVRGRRMVILILLKDGERYCKRDWKGAELELHYASEGWRQRI